MEHKQKQYFGEIKTDEPGLSEGEFIARVATFNGWPTGQPDSYGDFIDPHAFDVDLATRGARRPLLWMHDANSPIGLIDHTVESTFLQGRGRFLLDVAKGREAWSLTKAGVLQWSIGYQDQKSTLRKDGTRLLQQIKLFESSVVSFAANEAAETIAVRSQGNGDVQGLAASLRRLTEGVSAWNAEHRSAATPDPMIAELEVEFRKLNAAAKRYGANDPDVVAFARDLQAKFDAVREGHALKGSVNSLLAIFKDFNRQLSQ